MTKKRKPIFKDGTCDNCLIFETLTRYRGKYFCRDCFVGDYNPEYVQLRLAQLLSGRHALAKAQETDECNQIRLHSAGKRKGGK